MEGRFRNNNYNKNQLPFMSYQQEESIDHDMAQQEEDAADSPPSSLTNDMINNVTSASSPKRSRRGLQKKVVQIPIKDIEGYRLKGESNTPPSDLWTWRKYGQKPIKGSPYPRGYYRCSSSKGCPARKQVERSRADPSMIVVTYSCEHNHPWPPSRTSNNSHNSKTSTRGRNGIVEATRSDPEPEPEQEHEPEAEQEDRKFRDIGGDESLITTDHDQFGWLGEMETTSSRVLESPMFTGDDADVASSFRPLMREEDEMLFADLDELPECSMVFRRGAEGRQRYVAPWCGTTTTR